MLGQRHSPGSVGTPPALYKPLLASQTWNGLSLLRCCPRVNRRMHHKRLAALDALCRRWHFQYIAEFGVLLPPTACRLDGESIGYMRRWNPHMSLAG